MTDFSRIDRVRRAASPLQLDLIEAFMAGRVNRRDFVRMGLALGLTGSALAACGGTSTPTTGGGTATDVGVGGSGATVKQGGTIRVASIVPASPLDSVAMIDLAAYGVVAQCYEYLCNASGDLQLVPGLAESWSPNADGSEWTFKLRQGVTWQDGSPLTTDDVIETFERLVEAGNSGLKGVIESGSVTAPDASTILFTLTSPNGNFPYLVSTDNPQTPITPKAIAAGTTLDASPNGSGPWKLTKYDAKTGASFARNDAWWGGKTPLDTVEWVFFEDLQAQVVALQSGSVDAIVQFQVLGGEGLLNDPNLNVIRLKAATHRQIWMRADEGQFADKRIRQALGFTLDREAMIQSLFKGAADIGNDHVFAPVYPYYDAAVAQRARDVEKAKALLAEAGASGLKTTLYAGKLQEIPDLAVLIQSNAAEAGFDLKVVVEDNGPFYGKRWCPETPADPPCSGAAELGIVDYGHRGTPDVYLNSALKSAGVWNSSQYASPEFDAAFGEFQRAIGVEAQKAAASKIEQILLEDSPVLVPYFYNYLSAHKKTYAGLQVTGLGQMNLSKAGLV